MRYKYLFLAFSLGLGLATAHAQTPTWTGAIQPIDPTPIDGTSASGLGLAIDDAGNQYVAGGLVHGFGSRAPATRVFGSTSLTGGPGVASGFVAKLSPAQQWLWAIKATSDGEIVRFEQAVVSPAGDTYAYGQVDDHQMTHPTGGTTVTVGTYTYRTTQTDASFITRLKATGQPQWLAGLSGARILASGWDNAAGNLVVAGEYSGTVTVGSTTLPAAPHGGVFVARLGTTGQWVSAVGFVPTGTTTNRQLMVYTYAVGSQGQVAMNMVLSDGQLTLGSSTITSTGSTDGKLIVAQYGAGQWQWSSVNATANAYYSEKLAYDRAGNVYMMADANSSSALTFGSDAVPADCEFVVRFLANGQPSGVASVVTSRGGGLPERGNSLAVDSQGNAVFTGHLYTYMSYTFGRFTLAESAHEGNYVACYNFGTQRWVYAQRTPAANNSNNNGGIHFAALALDAAGTLVATGNLQGNVTFGPTRLTSQAAFGSNVFVARLANAGLPLPVRQAAGMAPLAVYPNPAAGGASATLRLPAAATTAQLLVLRDALGRVARQVTIPAGCQEVAVSTAGLAPGLYLLEAGLSRTQLVVE